MVVSSYQVDNMKKCDMKYIVGAYVTAPSLVGEDKPLESDFYKQLINSISEIRGLEIPFWGKDIHRFGSDFLLEIIKPDWDNILSCIPGTMTSLANAPKFGLASDDEQGRVAAVAMHKRANQMLHRMNERFGRQSIIAVQIATAPSVPVEGVTSSVYSFSKSMDELLSWDWGGAKIIIEHCDAAVVNQPFIKGFFSIEDEIKVLSKFSDNQNVGIMINWGRSAIEGRSSAKPLEHLKLVSENNLLSGLIFSGVSDNDELYGSWSDTHMPFSKSYDVINYEENSLLSHEVITNVLSAVDIDKLDYLGIKLLSMPVDTSSIERRVGLNKDAITILNNVISELN
jgi:hypothetical protein